MKFKQFHKHLSYLTKSLIVKLKTIALKTHHAIPKQTFQPNTKIISTTYLAKYEFYFPLNLQFYQQKNTKILDPFSNF